jgi:hypothetical protein
VTSITPVVLAAPYTPPPPPLPRFTGMEMTWTGWDGSVWDLTSASSGVIVTKAGLRGLHMPEHERWSRSAPLVPGSRHLGHQVLDRSVFWPIAVFHDATSRDWITLDRAFWRTMDPDREGTWTVVLPTGERRYLKCRFVDDSSHSLDKDPILKGWDVYGINMVADYPYWRGDVVTNAVQAADPVTWMDPEDEPFMSISQAASLSAAAINNPGDIDAHPTFWVHGPTDSASVGAGGRSIGIPFEIDDGKTLVVDCNPTSRSAKLINSPDLNAPFAAQVKQVEERVPTGTDRTKDLSADSNLNIKVSAGGRQDLELEMAGAGRIRTLITPSYRRAW